jgi:hypothetical protein
MDESSSPSSDGSLDCEIETAKIATDGTHHHQTSRLTRHGDERDAGHRYGGIPHTHQNVNVKRPEWKPRT